ncbi:MAG: amidohydrolase family protein [Anaerolineales bacterium]|nr:amidohydrolase family protein [Anaerolineales bacterium]
MIILPDWLITSAQDPPREHWGIRFAGDVIVDVAPGADLLKRYPEDEVLNASGQVLAPGFVNAHIHLYGVLAHGLPLDKAPSGFWPFLEDFWWPLVEDRLDSAKINAATDYRCAQLLSSGVTSFYNCTEAPNALPGVLFSQAEIVHRWGLRGILSFEATQRISEENGQLGLQENADFSRACKTGEGLMGGMICHHTTFTCSPEFIQQAYKLAEEVDVLLHAHVSEGAYEPEYTQKTFGKRTLQVYADLGVTGPRFLASQCVQITAEEIEIIASSGTRMSHMPLSNCEVGGGFAPVPQLVEAGAVVGLGSDGYIENFFEVMRGAFLVHKANQQDPRVMPADLVWYLATEGGANSLGLKNVGRLEKGWQADLQLIKPTLPTPLEGHNLYDQLLLYCSAADVHNVWVAGKQKVRDGLVLGADWDRLRAHTREAAHQLWSLT